MGVALEHKKCGGGGGGRWWGRFCKLRRLSAAAAAAGTARFFSFVVLQGVVLGPAAVVGLKGSPRGHGLMCKQCAKLKCVILYMFWHFLMSGGGSVQELA